MKHTYTVIEQENGVTVGESYNLTARQAAKVARERAATHPERSVFVEFYRQEDGQQRGYLNPDGNHDIVGRAW